MNLQEAKRNYLLWKKLTLLVILLGLGILLYYRLVPYLQLDYVKGHYEQWRQFYAENYLQTVMLFSCFYIVVTGLSLPGAAVMTLAAGAIFDLWQGVVIVSIASTCGASLSFALARYLARDFVKKRFAKSLAKINEKVEEEGESYLFVLRLVPLFPYFLVNICMGLTDIKFFKYFLISWIGMIPGIFLYINAGEKLGNISSVKSVFDLKVMISLTLVGLFPWLAKIIYKKFRKSGAGRSIANFLLLLTTTIPF